MMHCLFVCLFVHLFIYLLSQMDKGISFFLQTFLLKWFTVKNIENLNLK